MLSRQFVNRSQGYSFIDYPLFTKTLTELPEKSSALLINTINQYSYCVAAHDRAFKKSLQKSDVLLPDGIAIVAAARLLTGKKVHKIAGADLHQYMLEDLNRKGGKCFYLGASDETLERIKKRVASEYPNVKVEAYSPPFKKVFSSEDNRMMVDTINEFQPDVVFVGMTAPKQEKWAYKHRNKLQTKCICTIGAVFDFYAGTTERPHSIYINLGLEWLGRLIKEPRRLWKRYLYFGPVFLWLIMKKKFEKNFAEDETQKSVLF